LTKPVGRALPLIQKSWGKKRGPHCATPGSHCRRNVLGALEYGANELRFEVAEKNVDSKTVCDFLQKIAESGNGRQTPVILDNARIHHAISEQAQALWLTENKMLLWFLPTYSPDLNLIEIVWRQAKHKWRAFADWTKDAIKGEIEKILGGYALNKINFW